MPEPLSVMRILSWIMVYKGKNAFRTKSCGDLMRHLKKKILQHEILVVQDTNEDILAVVTGSKDFENKTLHVENIVAVKKGLKLAAQFFKKNFPGWKITASRRGRALDYADKTNNLIEKIFAYGK